MKALLVYPHCPDTFWSYRHALRFISRKASFPPLGLLTVAAMLPAGWEKRVVDMNVTGLAEADLRWADCVFVSAMEVQQVSAREVITRCQRLGVRVVAGGPLFTTVPEQFPEVDHLVLGEAEVTLPIFLRELAAGVAQHVYSPDRFPEMDGTPTPEWSLINMKRYSSMAIQYSRGCPFDCEFCDIVVLNGRKPRTKSREQMLAELDAIYDRGWRGGLFVVDDNFIGNKTKLKAEILPAMIDWAEHKRHPFSLSTEASINLADDEELMQLMAEAGFSRVFVGIESPNEESLAECNKNQNRGRDLIESVKRLQRHGMEVQGGFIVGFDKDPLSIFRSQIDFIEKSGIVTAMVGLLNAPRGTRLYNRLKTEGRLVKTFSGDNTDLSINFEPRMSRETLIDGYKTVLGTVYSPRQYYRRIRAFLDSYRPVARTETRLEFRYVKAFLKSLWILGLREKGRGDFWELILHTLMRRPRVFPLCIYLSVCCYHCRKVVEKYLAQPLRGTSATS